MSSISKSCTKPSVINSVIQLLPNAEARSSHVGSTACSLSQFLCWNSDFKGCFCWRSWLDKPLPTAVFRPRMLFVTVFGLFLNSFLLCCSTQCLSGENRRGMPVKNHNVSAIRVINIFSRHFFSRWIQGWDLFLPLLFLPVCAPKPGLKRNTG